MPGFSAPLCRAKRPYPEIPEIRLQKVLGGFTHPVHLAHSNDGSKRLFVVEQAGKIYAVDSWMRKKLFLDIRDRVHSGGEMGLLSVAFHPEFKKNRWFFVNYTTKFRGVQLRTRVSRFLATEDGSRGREETEKIVLEFRQPFPNHNGGLVLFGPDGYLYIGTGDGGAANDPMNFAQKLNTILGKILRIDVNVRSEKPYLIPEDNPFLRKKGARPEIYAFGLRNPWRFSFDPLTRRLYVGDVGQDHREEIDVVQAGRNYGWRVMEGKICTPAFGKRCRKKGLTLPIWDYGRDQGIAVTGGFVYRGQKIKDLCGVYIFGDFGSGNIWGLRYDGARVVQLRLLLKSGLQISSFGEDEDRELYVVDYGGGIYKIVP